MSTATFSNEKISSTTMEIHGQERCYDSENDSKDSDDSQGDPIFNVLEDTRFNFSNLSIKSITKARTVKVMDERNEQESDVTDMTDEQDQKSYETIQKIIQGGHVEKLKVDQCKVYLRKHGLRLSGDKETLIRRIKEHLDIVNGSGEEKYPPSSFVLNCKGDACTGDVVIFEQNVYEVFSIASRSANCPPFGTRIVAGRIVKESYGAVKQQHTFTIEVLWNKGEKPLPPLHQLLIKGRNLYRLKTTRQKWEDEGERARILSEKHARGDVARLNRESRIQNKEMRKLKKQPMREKKGKQDEDGKGKTLRSVANNQPNQKQHQECAQTYNKRSEFQIPNQPGNLQKKSNNTTNLHMPPERQPLIGVNCSFLSSRVNNFGSSQSQTARGILNLNMINTPTSSPIHGGGYFLRYFTNSNNNNPPPRHTLKENERSNSMMSPLRGFGHNNNYCYVQPGRQYNMNFNRYTSHDYPSQENFGAPIVNEQKKKICVYYPQGRCHFGARCKYLHE